MKSTGNTILITGGGSGIGRGLAEAFHALGNQVIISGRREKMLEETTSANEGMKSLTVDMDDPDSIKGFAEKLWTDFPALNVVINNAGIMRNERMKEAKTEDAEAVITTNLLGPIRLIAALMPHLLKQPHAAIMNVTSGLAFVPLALTPAYSATKAGMHSYTESLRYQLADTAVEVLELIPPYVATELMGDRQKSDPRAMPLPAFIAEVMEIIKTQPEATEICVKNVNMLRYAAEGGQEKYRQVFKGFNDAMFAERKDE